MRPWWAALVMLLVTLSGCSGTGENGGSDAPSGPGGEAAKAALAASVPAPLVLDSDVPINGTIVIEDKFPLADTCNVDPDPGCPERVHDLGAQLPAGVPIELAVDITWPIGDALFHMEAWVEGDDMTFLRLDNTTLQGGHWRWTALVVPGASSRAIVISGGPQSAAQADDNPYHLEVTFTANNQTVPKLVPIAVELGPNSTLGASSDTGEPVPFLLYGPDDLLLQKVEGNVTLPADAARGVHIALPLDRATFFVPGGGKLRYVGVLFTASDELTVPAGGSASVEVSSATPPFLAAAYYYGGQQAPQLMFSIAVEVTLADPEGKPLATKEACQPFCLGGFSGSSGTGFGVPLKAGSYTLTAQSQVAHDTYVGAFLVTFDRSVL